MRLVVPVLILAISVFGLMPATAQSLFEMNACWAGGTVKWFPGDDAVGVQFDLISYDGSGKRATVSFHRKRTTNGYQHHDTPTFDEIALPMEQYALLAPLFLRGNTFRLSVSPGTGSDVDNVAIVWNFDNQRCP